MKTLRHLATLLALPLLMTSCFNDEPEEDYSDWYKQNTDYIAEQVKLKNEDGTDYYETIVPAWAPTTYILMHWHKRSDNRFMPLDNSIVDIKYQGRLVTGDVFDSSFNNKVPTDSIYRSRPSQNIMGMRTAMAYMAPGDSCTVIMPPNAAYGSAGTASIKPFSALIFDMKMVDIVCYDVPY